MKLIVGLGNPGAEYAATRHNAGFLALDRLKDRHAPGAIPRQRFEGLTVEAVMPPSPGGRGEGPGQEERCVLLKPMTYMNLSGRSVSQAVRFYKLDPTRDVFVLVDDVALPCGAIRVRATGSAGGHNGLDDIERSLGTRDYARCRIGVDAPSPQGRIAQKDYVLGRFTAEQLAGLQPALDRACDAARAWATRGIDTAMNRFNVSDASDGGTTPERADRGVKDNG